MKTLSIVLLVLVTTSCFYSCELFRPGSFAHAVGFIEILGDSGKVVTVSYNDMVTINGEVQNYNEEITKEVTIPARITMDLAITGKTMNDENLCSMRIRSDGHTNVRGILIDISTKFEGGCPIALAFKFLGGDDCDDYTTLGSDSLITLLKAKNYPCIIELHEGESEGYTSTAELSDVRFF